ncbi:MAG: antibiotic biosynthesis monooxygenase [Acidobacteria bacterium]|nr:MAG: antibiotic biosynthesis monooxygenase [Acidobacteriota bacterium]TDI45659.1 MAG: antibiotic biosynthesis monooxygenase [Acidobacteriota bacterium]
MNDTHIRVVARLMAQPGKTDELGALLRGLLAPTRGEEGCITYELLQNRQDPTDFTFVEEWTREDLLEAHLASPHLQAARSRFPDLLAAEPDIRRYSVAG